MAVIGGGGKQKNIASIRKAGTCAGVPSLEENGIIANKPAEKSDNGQFLRPSMLNADT